MTVALEGPFSLDTPVRPLLLCLLASAFAAGCSSKQDEAGAAEDSATATSKPSTKAAAPTTSAEPSAAPAPPPPPPSPADLEKKTWTEDGATVALERTDLSKKCLLKGLSLMLPEKAKIEPLMGARGCVVRPWGEKGPYLFVVNDELNFNLKPKEELKGIKRVVEETSDSWLIEDEDPKTGFAGRVTRKLGERTVWCNANVNGHANGEQIGRGLVKLCSTLEFSPPDTTTNTRK